MSSFAVPAVVGALGAVAFLSLALTAFCYACAMQVVRRPTKRRSAYPPISVLTPLCGTEEGLYENLAALASQEYPAYELVIGAEDASDEALHVADQVRRDFTSCLVKVVAGAPIFGANPKVRNLASLASHAQYDHVVISDSNVRPPGDYLRSLADELARPGARLVTSLLAGTGEKTFGSTLENLHLNCFVASSVAAAYVVGHPVVVGKSMLFARRDLDRLGGFGAVADFLAEDYLIGRRFANAGLGIVLSPHVLPVVHRRRSLREFISRHVRWAQMRRRVFSGAFFAEPLLNPTIWLVAVLIASVLQGPRWASYIALLCLAAKVIGDALLACRLRGEPHASLAIGAIPIKDLLVAAIWLMGAFKREVAWRGHRLQVGAGSGLAPAREKASGSVVTRR